MTKPQDRNRSKTPYRKGGSASSAGPDEGWIWGRHAVLAALANPRRKRLRLVATRNAETDLPDGAEPQIVLPGEIDALLPPGAVHQGIALKTAPLEGESLAAVTDPTHGVLLVLDQITDPHNAGAVFRSAAAFGVRAIIMQDRKSPPLFGALAKAAVGAAEIVPHVSVVNIADAILALRKAGRYAVGLAGEAETALPQVLAGPDGKGLGPGLVLVLGSEDKGLRARVAESCDVLARIPTTGRVESLNVSNAAAVALYEAWRGRLPA